MGIEGASAQHLRFYNYKAEKQNSASLLAYNSPLPWSLCCCSREGIVCVEYEQIHVNVCQCKRVTVSLPALDTTFVRIHKGKDVCRCLSPPPPTPLSATQK